MILEDILKKKGSKNKEILKLLKGVDVRYLDNSFIADDILLDALKEKHEIIIIPFASIVTEYDEKKYNGTCMVTEGKNVYSVCYRKAYQGLEEHILIDFDTVKFSYSV